MLFLLKFHEYLIFLTGGTGFLGKILIEKLLRSFPQIGTIYVLIRPKKGKDMKTRLDEFFTVQVMYILISLL